MRLNPTCWFFSSGLRENLLKHIKLRVATVSLLVPAAVATECKPCSRLFLFFFFFSGFSVLVLIKRAVQGEEREKEPAVSTGTSRSQC